jgi:hypothetical protein
MDSNFRFRVKDNAFSQPLIFFIQLAGNSSQIFISEVFPTQPRHQPELAIYDWFPHEEFSISWPPRFGITMTQITVAVYQIATRLPPN